MIRDRKLAVQPCVARASWQSQMDHPFREAYSELNRTLRNSLKTSEGSCPFNFYGEMEKEILNSYFILREKSDCFNSHQIHSNKLKRLLTPVEISS